jgi:hypothetical protein
MPRRTSLVRSTRNRAETRESQTRAKRAAKPRQFVICIDNTDYPADLEVGKVYPVLPDKKGASVGMIRVIDESGEDYLYSAEQFVPIQVPDSARRAVLRAR